MLVLTLALLMARPPGLPASVPPAGATARVSAVYRAIDAATADPKLRLELRRICRRESKCNRDGITTWHAADGSGGRARWEAAVQRGMLDPEGCPAHALGDPRRWTSYGVAGVAAAWTVRYAGPCVGPEALDDPRTAMRAAVAWSTSLCRRQGACSCEARTRWWVGPGKFAERSRWQQLVAVEKQCGDLPWWRWAVAAIADAFSLTAGVGTA